MLRVRPIVVATAALPAAVALAAVSAPVELELPRDAAVTIVGPSFAPGFPRSTHVDAVGDVNGDRRPDLLVANRQGHGGDAARAYVLFGGSWPRRINLAAVGARGFRTADFVEPAGDVNGDGRDDLIACGRSARILFGRSGRRAAAPGSGFSIAGADCGSRAGDVDRDGRDDLIFLTYSGARPAGATIVFGRRSPASIHVSRSGQHGFRIVARRSRLNHVAPAGDLNGDGRADLLVHTTRGGPPSLTNRLHVAFGRRRTGTLDLDAASLPAIVDLGRWPADFGAAGDVNGDGIGDAIVSRTDGQLAYTVCVVLGRRGAWPRTTSCGGKGGFAIGGAGPRSGFGGGVQAAGDLNGDRLGDVLVSAPGELQPGAEFGGGAVYVVYGRPGAEDIDVTRDDGVVRIAAGPDLRESFRTYASPGDLTGDGRHDLVVGGDLLGHGWIVALPPP